MTMLLMLNAGRVSHGNIEADHLTPSGYVPMAMEGTSETMSTGDFNLSQGRTRKMISWLATHDCHDCKIEAGLLSREILTTVWLLS